MAVAALALLAAALTAASAVNRVVLVLKHDGQGKVGGGSEAAAPLQVQHAAGNTRAARRASVAAYPTSPPSRVPAQSSARQEQPKAHQDNHRQLIITIHQSDKGEAGEEAPHHKYRPSGEVDADGGGGGGSRQDVRVDGAGPDAAARTAAIKGGFGVEGSLLGLKGKFGVQGGVGLGSAAASQEVPQAGGGSRGSLQGGNGAYLQEGGGARQGGLGGGLQADGGLQVSGALQAGGVGLQAGGGLQGGVGLGSSGLQASAGLQGGAGLQGVGGHYGGAGLHGGARHQGGGLRGEAGLNVGGGLQSGGGGLRGEAGLNVGGGLQSGGGGLRGEAGLNVGGGLQAGGLRGDAGLNVGGGVQGGLQAGAMHLGGGLQGGMHAGGGLQGGLHAGAGLQGSAGVHAGLHGGGDLYGEGGLFQRGTAELQQGVSQMPAESVDLGALCVLASMQRNLPSPPESFGSILASLNFQNLGRSSRPAAQSFVSRLLLAARGVQGGSAPGALAGPNVFQSPPGGRLLELWDTASITLLATQGDMNSLRGPPRQPAMTVLQAFSTMSSITPDQEQSLFRVTGDQLVEVVAKSTLGLEDSIKTPAVESSANLVDLVLTICGLQLPGATPAARTGLATIALTLYECVAENDRRPANKGKVEMVNRLLVQKFQSPHTVSMTDRVTNAELLARLMQRMPEAAAGRIVDAVSSVSPNSPNPAAIHNRKMREWRSMDLCSGVVLRMAGLQRKEREPFRIKHLLQ